MQRFSRGWLHKKSFILCPGGRSTGKTPAKQVLQVGAIGWDRAIWAIFGSGNRLDSSLSADILPRSGSGGFSVEVPWREDLAFRAEFMKRQYQPSKIRRKRQHGFLSRNSSKSGKGILRNRRRVGRKRLTPV